MAKSNSEKKSSNVPSFKPQSVDAEDAAIRKRSSKPATEKPSVGRKKAASSQRVTKLASDTRGLSKSAREFWKAWGLTEVPSTTAGATPSAKSWLLAVPKSDRQSTAAATITDPLELNTLLVEQHHNEHYISELSISLDSSQLLAKLQLLAPHFFGDATSAEFRPGPQQSILCLFQAVRPGAKEQQRGYQDNGAPLPEGIFGYRLGFDSDGRNLRLKVWDFWGIGYVPESLATEPLKLSIAAFGLEGLTGDGLLGHRRSIFEISFSLNKLAFVLGLLRSGKASKVKLRKWLDQAADCRLKEGVYLRSSSKIKGSSDAQLVMQTPDRELENQNSPRTPSRSIDSTSSASFILNNQSGSLAIEILESRQLANQFAALDAKFRQGELIEALKIIDTSNPEGPGSIYLARRYALLCTVGLRSSAGDKLLRNAFQVEPQYKLFLSAAARLGRLDSDSAVTLQNLSELASGLFQLIEGSDEAAIFDVVLPEALGDAWASENTHQAEACYTRVLERRGDLPRIIRKLINLCRSDSRSDAEASYITRLLKVERRRAQKAQLLLRLASIRGLQKETLEEALDSAMRALELDSSLHEAALLAADILWARGSVSEAIELLDRWLERSGVNRAQLIRIDSADLKEAVSKPETASSPLNRPRQLKQSDSDNDSILPSSHNVSAEAQSLIEERIGTLWADGLGRNDLAIERYKTAYLLWPANKSVTERLEANYRSKGQTVALASLLEERFASLEASGAKEELRTIFEELAALYRGVLDRPRQVMPLYLRLLPHLQVPAEGLERLLNRQKVEVEWDTLYGALENQLERPMTGNQKFRLHLQMYSMARHKLTDENKAVDHLGKAAELAPIDETDFVWLMTKLQKRTGPAAVVEAYKKRLTQVDVESKARLMLELYHSVVDLTDEEKDDLAIEIAKTDEQFETPLLERLNAYQEQDKWQSILTIVDRVTDAEWPKPIMRRWHRRAVLAVQGCTDGARLPSLLKLYKQSVSTSEDPTTRLHEAIQGLFDAGDGSAAQPFLIRLIDAGELPKLPDGVILRLLDRQELRLAKYHQLRAMEPLVDSKDKHTAAANARLAASLYKRLPDCRLQWAEMLRRISSIGSITSQELQDLETLSSETSSWTDLATVYEEQLAYLNDPNEQRDIFIKLGVILTQHLKSYERAKEKLSAALKLPGHPEQVWQAMIDLGVASGEDGLQREYLLSQLTNLIKDPEASLPVIGELLTRLIDLGDRDELLPVIENYVNDPSVDYQRTIKVVTLATEAGLHSVALHQKTVDDGIAQDDQTVVSRHWWQALAATADKAAARQYMRTSRKRFEQADRLDWLIAACEIGLKSGLRQQLSGPALREVLIRYGELLFENQSPQMTTLKVYQEAFLLDQRDFRTWMPLYFLLHEFGSPMQRLGHLRAMLPLLKNNPKPLRPYPMTFESLQNELSELEGSHQAIKDEQNDFSEPLQINEPLTTALGGPLPARLDAQSASIPLKNSKLVVPTMEPGSLTAGLDDGASAVDLDANRLDDFLPPIPTDAEELYQRDSIIKLAKPLESADPMGIKEETGSAIKLGGLNESADTNSWHPKDSVSDSESDSRSIGDPTTGSIKSLDQWPSLDLDEVSDHAQDQQDVEQLNIVDGSGDFTDSLAALNSSVDEVPKAVETAEPTRLLSLDEVGQATTGDYSKNNDLTSDFNVEAGKFAKDTPPKTYADSGQPNDSYEDSNLKVVPSDAHDNELKDGIVVNSFGLHSGSAIKVSGSHSVPTTANPGDIKDDTRDSINGGSVGVHPAPTKYNIDEIMESPDLGVSHSDDSVVVPTNTDYSASSVAVVGTTSNAFSEMVKNWRQLIDGDGASNAVTQRILNQAFTSDLEKHIAIQVAALLAGDCSPLQNWHWRVWRHVEEYGYGLEGRERYPASSTPDLLNTALHKYLIALSPLFVKANRASFAMEGLAKRLGYSREALEERRQPLTWSSDFIVGVGLQQFFERFERRSLQIFDLKGLGSEIFYDGANRSIYFDLKYYREQPPSHLFHRILRLVWSIKLRFLVPLTLNAEHQLMPLLNQVHEVYSVQGLARVGRFIRPTPLVKQLQKLSHKNIEVLYAKVGMPNLEAVKNLQAAMRRHLVQLVMAETLDVVGSFEALLDRDLLAESRENALPIKEMHESSQEILTFCTQLIV